MHTCLYDRAHTHAVLYILIICDKTNGAAGASDLEHLNNGRGYPSPRHPPVDTVVAIL